MAQVGEGGRVHSGGLLRNGFGRRVLRGDQFRPDTVPVIRAEVAAGDGACSGALDYHAALCRHRALTTRPLTDRRLPDAKQISQRRLASNAFDRSLNGAHVRNHRHCR